MIAMIQERKVAPKLDSVVRPDGWAWAGRLVRSDWDRADFYLTTNSGGPIKELAVRITITGRTIQRREGDYWVRVRIEFVGDGEPSSFTKGWMRSGWNCQEIAI